MRAVYNGHMEKGVNNMIEAIEGFRLPRYPLAELYDDWIKRETSEMDNFRSSIECCANDAIRGEKERKAQNKDAPER